VKKIVFTLNICRRNGIDSCHHQSTSHHNLFGYLAYAQFFLLKFSIWYIYDLKDNKILLGTYNQGVVVYKNEPTENGMHICQKKFHLYHVSFFKI
jgi:hypothetical protein